MPILDRYRVDDDRMFAHIVCHLVNEQPLPRELRTALAGLAGLSHAHTGLSDHDPAADHADTGRPTHTWTGTGAELWDCAVSVAGLDGATTWVPDQTLAAAIGA